MSRALKILTLGTCFAILVVGLALRIFPPIVVGVEVIQEKNKKKLGENLKLIEKDLGSLKIHSDTKYPDKLFHGIAEKKEGFDVIDLTFLKSSPPDSAECVHMLLIKYWPFKENEPQYLWEKADKILSINLPEYSGSERIIEKETNPPFGWTLKYKGLSKEKGYIFAKKTHTAGGLPFFYITGYSNKFYDLIEEKVSEGYSKEF